MIAPYIGFGARSFGSPGAPRAHDSSGNSSAFRIGSRATSCAATDRTEHEIVLATLHFDVAHRDRRQAGMNPRPVVATVDSEEQTVLRPSEEQILVHVVFGQRPHELTVGKVSG